MLLDVTLLIDYLSTCESRVTRREV